jgi:hypothetical protein
MIQPTWKPRVFAERLLREGGPRPAERIQFAFRQVLGRPARPEEVDVLAEVYAKHRRQYGMEKESAAAVLGVGDRLPSSGVEVAELAAWTSVARVILNLHETITRN